jgi:REP element-mobilizing transposase RayT
MHNRKLPRLQSYDYSANGYYFITICTHDKKHLFGRIENGEMLLNESGHVAENELLNIPEHFPGVSIQPFVVMPNHVHAVIIIQHAQTREERSRPFPTVSEIVGLYKSGVSRLLHEVDPGLVVWQKSFYDHIIRDEKGYREICDYIQYNSLKWENDEYR